MASLKIQNQKISSLYMPTLWVVYFMVCWICLSYLGQLRFVARDEGFYLLASRLVAEGSVPYRDFFYPQMPLFPILYGYWMELFGQTWESARCLSALLTVSGLFCAAAIVYRRYTSVPLSGLLVFMGITSPFLFSWFITAQTYALAAFFCLASVYCLERYSGDAKCHWIFFAGTLLGAATCTRLFYGALIPLIWFWIIKGRRSESKRLTANFSIGVFLGLLPAWVLLISAPDQFVFNNLGYHLIRSPRGFIEDLTAKKKVLMVLLGLRKSVKFYGWGISPYILFSAVYFIYQLIERKRIALEILVCITLFIVYFLPTPTYVQYFSTILPFLLIASTSLLAVLWSKSKNKFFRCFYAFLLFVFVSVQVSSISQNILQYTKSGRGVIGVGLGTKVDAWKLTSVKTVSAELDEVFPDSAKIISDWPGYIFESKISSVSGFENHFGQKVAPLLNSNEKERFHVRSIEDTKKIFEDGLVPGAVLNERQIRRYYRDSLSQGGYELRGEIGDVKIFVLSGS